MADRGDRLAGLHRVAREIDHRVAHAHLVGRVAAGNDERVEVLHARGAGGEVGRDDGLAALAAVLGAGRRADDRRPSAPAARSASSGPVSSRSSNSSSTSIATRLPASAGSAHAGIVLQGSADSDIRGVIMRSMNRLARERSPYLLQHADNPVDWYPWGDEAFAKARARGQADLPVDRLLHLPLVPRDGARVVRERRRSPRCSTSTSCRSRSIARSGRTSIAST